MTRILFLVMLFVVISGTAFAQSAETGDATWTVETDDGLTLFGESFGAADGDDVLFVHGGPSFPPMQRPEWLAELSKTYHIHLFHHRGSGRSSRSIDRLPNDEEAARALVVKTYGIERHLRDIDEVAHARFGDQAVNLIGHSFGGYLAMLYAAEHPERISALVLLAPADVLDGVMDKPVFEHIGAKLPEADRAGYRKEMEEFLKPESIAGATDAELAARTDLFGWYFMRAIGINFPKPGTYPAMRWSGGAAVAGLFIDLAERGDARSHAQSISASTLIIHGGQDISPESASQMYADSIEDAQLVTFERESHFFDRDPPQVSDAIAAFLKESDE